MKKLLFTITFLMFLGIVVYAQNVSETGKNEIMVWGGFSPDTTTLIRGTCRSNDARYGVLAFRYTRRFDNNKLVNLKYTMDFVPFAILHFPDKNVLPNTEFEHPTAKGYGMSPVGLQINFRPRKKYQPFIGGSGGFLYFDRQVPNLTGTRFVFTEDITAGLEIKLKDSRAITFGYKYYHISNAGRGQQNPGFDNNLFYIGYTCFSK